MAKVLSCHNSNIDIFMLIDEEHKYKDTANQYIASIQPKHILRVSATPISFGDATEEITDDEVDLDDDMEDLTIVDDEDLEEEM